MAIAFVQCAGNFGAATTLATTIAAPGAGNQLIVCVATDSIGSTVTINALTSQVWTKLVGAPTLDGGATTPDLVVFMSTNPGTGTSVSVTGFGTNPCEMVVFEFSGTLGTATTDGASTSTTAPATGTTVTPTSFTPTVANGVAISMCATDSTVTISGNPSGYTVPAAGVQVNGAEQAHAGYQLLSGTPLVAPVWTTGSANTQFANSFVVKPAAAGAVAAVTHPFKPVPFMSPPGGNRYG